MTFTTNHNDTGSAIIADTLAAYSGQDIARDRFEIPIRDWPKVLHTSTPSAAAAGRYAVLANIGEPWSAHTAAPVYIGIAGAKRAGKDTLARELQADLGLPIDSFAAPLRKFVADLAGMGGNLDVLEVHKETPIPWLDGVTARQMMQTVGTEWGRQMVHPDLWVRALFARLPAGGIIPDVRFPNEAEAIRQRGGVVIRVSRPGYGKGDSHASEAPLPGELVDFEVANNATPGMLAARALADLRGHGVI
ncbi:hypothetical protein [Stenotrophomonas maltophilia]|uniref:deoxynucleotide monophosphate kinase family protein n=1 Tax=Stenotrophomonas maltophilia TaxID=40324 RepID=UPI002B1E7F5E|nr:hypothetical protein [Stenotrophomonas maltophilia]